MYVDGDVCAGVLKVEVKSTSSYSVDGRARYEIVFVGEMRRAKATVVQAAGGYSKVSKSMVMGEGGGELTERK